MTGTSPGKATGERPLHARLAHWVNAVALLVMLTSGLQIFNAHPALYLGRASDFDRPVLIIGARENADFSYTGVTRVLGRPFVTTGVLGVSGQGEARYPRAFPAWITLPPGQDLALARVWHFFFAWVFVLNGAVFIGLGLARGRLRRALVPTLSDLGRLGADVVDHLRLRFAPPEAGYGPLQKLAYAGALFGLGPLMIATGMSLSPGLNAALPWLPEVFGGRQGARTIHFLGASGLVLFFLVHMAMLLASGPWRRLRGMILGGAP